MVIEFSDYTLTGGTRLEADCFETNKVNKFESVTFVQTYQKKPVVIAAISSFNEVDSITGRLRNIGTQSFELGLRKQESNLKAHQSETINYIAWEPSEGKIENFIFEISNTENIVNNGFHNIQFNQSFMSDPVFLADMQTADRMDGADIRWRKKNKQSVEVQIDEK